MSVPPKTTKYHTEFQSESPFAITRVAGTSGGKIGGNVKIFGPVTTALEPSQNVFRGS